MSSTDHIYHRAAKRRGDKFDRSMTRGKLLGNNAPLFIFISILIMTQLISFLWKNENKKFTRLTEFLLKRWSSQAPNTVSISTFIKYVRNLDGVKLHWVGGKHLFFQWIWTRYVNFYISSWKILPPGTKNLPPKSVFWLHFNHC